MICRNKVAPASDVDEINIANQIRANYFRNGSVGCYCMANLSSRIKSAEYPSKPVTASMGISIIMQSVLLKIAVITLTRIPIETLDIQGTLQLKDGENLGQPTSWPGDIKRTNVIPGHRGATLVGVNLDEQTRSTNGRIAAINKKSPDLTDQSTTNASQFGSILIRSETL